MFKARKLKYRPWPITVTLQGFDEDACKVVEESFSFVGHFGSFSEKTILALRREIFGDEADAGNQVRLGGMTIAERADLEATFYARLLCGWSKVTEEDGVTVVPYSAEMLREFCTGDDGPAFRRALDGAINELRFGIAPLKNSETSPAPGPAQPADEVPTSSTTT